MTEQPDEKRSERVAENMPLPGGDFRLFIQKLGYQALISMGIVENPLTKLRDTNLGMAKGVIDDLRMLRDKSRGNLEDDEQQHLDAVIGDLQKHFVALSEAARG